MRKHLTLLLTGLLLFTAVGSAQQLSQITGSVTDPSGALVVGAALKLESLTKGTTREEVSDKEGRYHFLQIAPDRYRITAKAAGFSDLVVNEVVVQVATPSTVDVKFEKVGAVAEVVSVSAEAVQVNTTDATLGNAIGAQPILQLPSFARNVAGLLALQPGVTVFGNVNGGKSDQGNVTLDGVDVNDQMERSAFTSVLRVTLDSVQEFRTTTTGANADQGRSSGAQVQLVTKSGTNDYHGSLYWYNRYTGLAANNWFNNSSGVKRPKLLINIPGGSIGGPIQKNKLFFFANWEQRNDRSAANVTRTVPSANLRNGIVSYRNAAGTRINLTPDDIKTRIDPLGIGVNQEVLKVFNSYPASNDTSLGDGINFQGYRFTAPQALKWNTYTTRFDYQLNAQNNLFVRGQLQNDRSTGTPQFPGDQPNSVALTNSKGIAAGWNSVLTNNIVSTFRYGFTRLSRETTGIQSAPAVSFRNLSDRYGLTTGISRQIPLHQFSEDMSWTKGKHAIQFGTTIRLISNQSNNFGRSFHSATTNVSWLKGTGADLQPADLSSGDRTAYNDSMMALLGIVSQGSARYNYTIDGSVLAVGAPIQRNFKNEEYEFYGQDTWRVNRKLTVTYGLRWSLTPPIHEANGVQISTNISMSDWFNKRGALADQGLSQEAAGRITFIRADDPAARPIYPFRKGNLAPRIGIAYSPDAANGFTKFLFGGQGKTSIRAGWGMYYDVIGQPLARTYDASAFGFATDLVNQSGSLTAATAPRFTGIYSLPTALIRPAPKGGFPIQFPSAGTGSFAITNTIDDQLQTPYTMNMNFSLGREFKDGLFIQGSFVGRQSRKSLLNRDLAMPTNLIDPKSGQSYFEAATVMARLVKAGAAVGNVPKVPFFENFYGNLATGSETASQQVFRAYRFYPNDWTSGLSDLDQYCDPDCSRLGPNAMMNPQFSALSAWSSVGGGNYYAMQWTVRKRFTQSLQFDFNYTYSKSTDLASVEENSGSFSGFLINSWNPGQRRAVSDYDQRHIYNAFWVWETPFGRGKKYASGINRGLDALIGGWQISGIWTQSTELPVSVGNGRNWPTNWNITGYGTPVTGINTPSTKTKNAPAVSGAGGPNLWANPAATVGEWDYTLPGQTGSRNTVRIDGRANWDMAFGKRVIMPYKESHSVQFRWEIFNIFNMVRFGGVDIGRTGTANWGKYSSQANTPRQMQIALRYEF
jgi:hypothetical protein